MRWVVLAALVLAVPAVVAARWFFGGDDAGTRVQARADLRGDVVDVRVPGRTVRVTVTAPAQRLEAGQTRDGERRRAARKTAWIGVGYALAPSPPGTVLPAGDAPDPDRAEVAVVSGGRRYPVRPQGDWIAVPGTGRRVTAEVTFEGVRQSADARTGRVRPGAAEGLYAIDGADTLLGRGYPCFPTVVGRPSTARAAFVCTIGRAVRAPWASGPGWAPPGREWVQVDVRTGLDIAVTGGGSPARRERGRWTITLDGRPPLEPATQTEAGGLLTDTGRLLFPSTPDAARRLRIEATYRLPDADVERTVVRTTDLDDDAL